MFNQIDRRFQNAELADLKDKTEAGRKKLQKETVLTIGAWGNHGKLSNRGREVINLINNLYCLRITKEGQPTHPLYLPSKLKPIIFK